MGVCVHLYEYPQVIKALGHQPLFYQYTRKRDEKIIESDIGIQTFYSHIFCFKVIFLLQKDQNICLLTIRKRSRQHAGKKYREYAQRRLCFVN